MRAPRQLGLLIPVLLVLVVSCRLEKLPDPPMHKPPPPPPGPPCDPAPNFKDDSAFWQKQQGPDFSTYHRTVGQGGLGFYLGDHPNGSGKSASRTKLSGQLFGQPVEWEASQRANLFRYETIAPFALKYCQCDGGIQVHAWAEAESDEKAKELLRLFPAEQLLCQATPQPVQGK